MAIPVRPGYLAVLSGTTLVALRLLKPFKRHPEGADRGVDRDDSG